MKKMGGLPETRSESIMAEMDKTEQLINVYFFRLEGLEKSLKYTPMTNAQREAAEKEIAKIKRDLLQEENRLQSLRKNNRGSVMIAVVLICCSFFAFGLYKMYTNNVPNASPAEPTKLEW